ncbi:hypothetical protein GE21DRAFT_1210027, partial [Neurospora crassa]
LDTIIIRLPDPAHSEFKGIAVYIYKILINTFFTPTSKFEYYRTLQKWPFPPN